MTKELFSKNEIKKYILLFLGSAILAFGMYNIHSISSITEGGVLGLTLLLYHWFNISPSVSGLIMNILCYLLGWKILGKRFLLYSFIASLSFSAVYALLECFPPVWPQIASYPLLASIAGALFVGIGCGICVRSGGATGGDDALSMALSKITSIDIQWIYLISDLSVLTLSLTYISWRRIIYSLLTVFLSGQIIGLIVKIPSKKQKTV